MSKPTDTPRLRRSDDVVARRIGDTVVLVPVRGERGDLETLFRLEEVAAFIWDRLEEPADEAELLDAVVAAYEVDRDTAAADLARFLGELREADLLVSAESA